MIKNALYGTWLRFIDRVETTIEARLLADSTEDFGMDVMVEGAGDGDGSGEAIVLQLAMRSPRPADEPTPIVQ
jgi:hypothetical protein